MNLDDDEDDDISFDDMTIDELFNELLTDIINIKKTNNELINDINNIKKTNNGLLTANINETEKLKTYVDEKYNKLGTYVDEKLKKLRSATSEAFTDAQIDSLIVLKYRNYDSLSNTYSNR